MVAVPGPAPPVRPPDIVAIVPDEELHVPGVVTSDREMVEPWHTEDGPTMAAGIGLTVKSIVVVQPDPVAYVMVATPADTPVTTPLVGSTVAIPVLLLDQLPPANASLSVDDALTQAEAVPVIGDNRFTFTVVVAVQPEGVV